MQGLPHIIEISAALIVLISASVWDIRFRRIPNAITLPAILPGLVWTAVCRTGTLPLTFIALTALFFFGTLHLMGQGDIKLIMAITAINGLTAALISTGIAAILIVGVQILLHPTETAKDAKNAFLALIKLDFSRIDREGRSVPFAPYIFAGFVCFTVYRLFFP
jgi:prepilin signal peptidase PulO-like enzyme (type II secretory pathway)